MTERMKVAFIGAGSFRFNTVLFMDIARAANIDLPPMEVGLCDIDEKSLDLATRYFTRIARKAKRQKGADITITASTDRRDVLENADFVYKSISVGIQESEFFDIYLPIKFGIPQNTGDTCGPGGVFRGLRTNPPSAAIAKDMAELCPKAPLLSYTNPQSTIVMAARTVAPSVQFTGLCHELFGGMKSIKTWYERRNGKLVREKNWMGIKKKVMRVEGLERWEDITHEYGGINHFGFITRAEYPEGQDLYPALREDAKNVVKEKLARPFNFYLLEKHGWVPYPGSRHVAEFLPDYYNYFNHETQCPFWSFPVIRDVPKLAGLRRFAYKMMRLSASGWFWVPSARNTGEKAMDMTIDWHKNNPAQHVVNIPNVAPGYSKIIPELPDDCVVEVPAMYKDGSITPIGTIHLPKEIASLVRPHAEQQRLTVDAALGNSPELVVKAMLHDPMCRWIEDDDKIEYLTKLMLYYQQEWLPDEWNEWIPKREELEAHDWWISEQDLSKGGKEYLKVKYPPDEKLRAKAFFWGE